MNVALSLIGMNVRSNKDVLECSQGHKDDPLRLGLDQDLDRKMSKWSHMITNRQYLWEGVPGRENGLIQMTPYESKSAIAFDSVPGLENGLIKI